MIILRQREFGNKENKRKRKEWEALQGKNIETINGGLLNKLSADDVARSEIQLEKNGGTGDMFGKREPVVLGGFLSHYYKGKNWKGDNWKDIPVSEDELLRRKYRDRRRQIDDDNNIANVDQAINARGKAASYESKNAFEGRRYRIESMEDIEDNRKEARKRMADNIKRENNYIFYDSIDDNSESAYAANLKSKKKRREDAISEDKRSFLNKLKDSAKSKKDKDIEKEDKIIHNVFLDS